MKEEFSEEWADLMQKEEKFRKAAGHFQMNVALETQKKDILLALENREGQLITTRLMSEGYINDKVIEQVWEKLVYLVFYGVVSVSCWSVEALKQIPYSKRKLYREKISELALLYAEKNKDDDISLNYGLGLLETMGNKESIYEYIQRFKEYLALEEEDVIYYQNIADQLPDS